LFFTFNQFISIVGTFFGSLQQAATGNSTINMTQINESIQNLALPGNISQNLVELINLELHGLFLKASSIISLLSSIPALQPNFLY
jgi:hypothetical protein